MVKYNVISDVEAWILEVLIDKYLYERIPVVEDLGEDEDRHIQTKYWGKNTNIQTLINRVLTLIYKNSKYESVRIAVPPRRNLKRTVSIYGKLSDGSEEEFVPCFTNMSSGESMILGMVASILKECDRVSTEKEILFDEIEGIVLIDEIDEHLHSDLLKEVLPLILKLFPKIQFIISSHSPFFLLGMQEIFGNNCEFVGLPSGIVVDGIENFDEIAKCYSIIDDSYDKVLKKLQYAKYKVETLEIPLIITEGKTDWKHLKNALAKLQAEGKFEKMNISFWEFGDKQGDSELENLLKNLAKIPHSNLVIGVFDNDSKIGKKYENNVEFGNNVFGISLKDTRGYNCDISIELLYSREELTKCDKDGRRIFLSDEFTEKGRRLKSDKMIVTTNNTIVDAYKRHIIKIVDSDVYDSDDKSIALSKEEFATNVLDKKAPFDDMDVSGFVEIFRKIELLINERK